MRGSAGEGGGGVTGVLGRVGSTKAATMATGKKQLSSRFVRAFVVVSQCSLKFRPSRWQQQQVQL